MKRLIFTRLTLNKFRSFNEPVTVDFSALGTGLHLLRGVNEAEPRLGANGAGKSSIWDGLLWTLFGKTVSGLKNADIQPWGNAKGTYGIVDLLINNEEHRVHRRASPNALTLDGRDVAQPAIDKLLGVSFPVLLHSQIFGQGRPLFFDLEPRRKLELFDEVLDLNRWLVRSEQAGKLLHKRENVEQRLVSDLESSKREYERLEEQRKQATANSRDWERARADRISEMQKQLDQYQKRRAVIIDDRDKADLELDSACTELKFLHTDIAVVESNVSTLLYQVQQKEIKVQVAKAEIERLERQMRMKGECPTCGQSVQHSANHRQHFIIEIQRLKNIRVPNKLHDRLERAKAELELLRTARSKYQDKESAARLTLDRLNPENASLEASIMAAQRAIEERGEEGNPYNRQLADMRIEGVRIAKDLEALQQDITVIRRKIERAKFWVQGFREIRLYIIDEVLQELALATNAMLDAMGLVGWEVRFSIERETTTGTISRALHVTILSPQNNKAVRWEVWSGGEAQRLRLAGSLALGEVLLNHAGVQSNLEVLDEPSRGMSRIGISDLCDFLAGRASHLHKVIVLTDHHAIAAARFKSTLTVVKDARGSHLA